MSMLTAVSGVALAPAAHAESGRRICMYLNNVNKNKNGTALAVTAQNPQVTNAPAHAWVVMNYKKKGGCPTVDMGLYSAMPLLTPPWKFDCENLKNYFPNGQLPSSSNDPHNSPYSSGHNPFSNAADPCATMDVDTAYVIWKPDNGAAIFVDNYSGYIKK
jgi:hypothetical protein